MPQDAVIIYLPLELACIVSRVAKLINPAIFIMMETEIWPNLIRILHKNGVPIILSNGRISQKSHIWYMMVKPVLKNILNRIDKFLMRTKVDAERVISIGAEKEKVVVVGNIKFDIINDYIDETEKQKYYKALGLEGKRLIVCGSTHPGEEELLLKSYRSLKYKYDDLLLLIAPRHIERAEKIAKSIKSYGFTPVMISQLTINHKPSTINSSVFLLNTLGQLKLFYSLSWVAFVGGSLIKHGGQNMIEPAFFGKPIIFG